MEDVGGSLRIRIRPTMIWSWGINEGAPKRFAGVEKRDIPPTGPTTRPPRIPKA